MRINTITVILSENGYKLEYIVKCDNGSVERYTDKNIPHSIVELLNWTRPIYRKNVITDNSKIFQYRY